MGAAALVSGIARVRGIAAGVPGVVARSLAGVRTLFTREVAACGRLEVCVELISGGGATSADSAADRGGSTMIGDPHPRHIHSSRPRCAASCIAASGTFIT
jgi:hypothetical protein